LARFSVAGDDPRAVLEVRLHLVLRALRPYLADLVLIGGWVPDLYRKYGAIADWTAGLSFTSELDVLISGAGLLRGERPELAVLLRDAGLRPDGAVAAPHTCRWVHADDGEAIEFLTPHRATWQSSSGPVSVSEQPGLTAIMLQDLELLARHTRVLHVAAGDDAPLPVRVPTLAAYVINKGLTFPRRTPRPGHASNPKRGKDLLYLRDLMAAGDGVAAMIDADMGAMLRDDPQAQFRVDGAISNIDFAVAGRFADDIGQAAEMLREREPGYSVARARADLLGHLSDAFDLLQRFRSPAPPAGDEDE
jgi:hypothetical protein